MKNPKLVHAVDSYVGARLRFLRIERRLSQDHLARQVGVTFQQVQKYEKGINRISASKLKEFGDVLHVPVRDFFEGLGDSADGALTTLNRPTAIDIEIIRLLSNVKDPELKKHLRSLIKALTTVAHDWRGSIDRTLTAAGDPPAGLSLAGAQEGDEPKRSGVPAETGQTDGLEERKNLYDGA